MKVLANKSRAVSLDFLRVFAAIWVLVHHWVSREGLSRNLQLSYDVSWIPGWISTFAKPGFLGVDIFFILSGVVIARSAIGRNWAEFARARFLRLYPAYVFAIALAILFAPVSLVAHPPVSETLVSLTGLQWFVGWPTIIGPAWTLFFEVRFYMLVGLVLLVCGPVSALYLRRAAKVWLVLLLLAPSLQLPWFNFLVIAEFGPYFVLGMLMGACEGKKGMRAEFPALAILIVMSWLRMTARLNGLQEIGGHGILAVALIGLCVAAVSWSERLGDFGGRVERKWLCAVSRGN